MYRNSRSKGWNTLFERNNTLKISDIFALQPPNPYTGIKWLVVRTKGKKEIYGVYIIVSSSYLRRSKK